MDFNSLRRELKTRNASVKELINDFFLKIDSKDSEINSYISITKDNALVQAENIDKLIQNEEILPPLAGIPPVSYTHLRAHETEADLVCRLLLEKKKNN